jgi:PST family polysaccharide transporter
MQYILYFNLIAKLITFLIIIFFLRKENDYNIYPLAFLIGYLISDLISFKFIFKHLGFKLYIPSLKRLLVLFKTSFKVFINNFIVRTYSSLNIIILGFFTNNLIVGYYSIGIKLSGVFSAFLGIFLQIIYPKFSIIAKSNFCKFVELFKKVLIRLLLISCLTLILYLFFEKNILKFLINNITKDLVNIVSLCSFLIIFSPMGNIFTNFFIISNEYNIFFKITLYTAIFNFIIFIVFFNINELYSLAFTMIITQLLHMSLNIFFYKKVEKNKCAEL